MLEQLVIAIALSVITTLIGFLIKAVYGLGKELPKIEERIIERVSALVDREKQESVLSHRRHGVTDRIVSKITDRDYDSRQIAEGGEYPQLHSTLKKVISGGDE